MDYKYIALLSFVRQLGEAEGKDIGTGGVHASYEQRAKILRIIVKDLCADMNIDPTEFHPYI